MTRNTVSYPQIGQHSHAIPSAPTTSMNRDEIAYPQIGQHSHAIPSAPTASMSRDKIAYPQIGQHSHTAPFTQRISINKDKIAYPKINSENPRNNNVDAFIYNFWSKESKYTSNKYYRQCLSSYMQQKLSSHILSSAQFFYPQPK